MKNSHRTLRCGLSTQVLFRWKFHVYRVYKGVVLQKQDLALCRSDLPGLCTLEGRHLLRARSVSTGFLSAADQDFCPTLRGEEETERTGKKKSGFPSDVMCLWPDMF